MLLKQDWSIPRKKKTCWVGEGWRYGISGVGIKEIACGISRGELKMNCNFQGWPGKKNIELPVQGSCFLVLEFPRDLTKICGTSWGGAVELYFVWSFQVQSKTACLHARQPCMKLEKPKCTAVWFLRVLCMKSEKPKCMAVRFYCCDSSNWNLNTLQMYDFLCYCCVLYLTYINQEIKRTAVRFYCRAR